GRHRRRQSRRADHRGRGGDDGTVEGTVPALSRGVGMAHPETLDRLVRRVAAQVRRRRAEHHALRGAFWASLPAVAVVALKGSIGPRAVPIAIGLVATGLVIGALWGLLKRTSEADAARLADRAFGL